MAMIRSTVRPGGVRRRVAILGAFSLLAICAQLVLAGSVAAGPLNGGFSPTVLNGRADVNGSGFVNGRDDSNAFYGDTHIIDGKLDCDAWSEPNDGTEGNRAITGADDCTLFGYDGTADGVRIRVLNGRFQVATGRLPTVFNADDRDNPDIGDSDFAWSAINGRVDSNGDEEITWEECHFGLVGVTRDAGLGDPTDGYDVLGSDGTNPCLFAVDPDPALNGRVDLNGDSDITGADSCSDRCFFGHNVVSGRVQELECRGFEGNPRNQVVGTPGADVLIGTSGDDIICGFAGNDILVGRGGGDLMLGGGGADRHRGGRGADTVRGGAGNDRLAGQRGRDVLRGGRGADTVRGGAGNDRLAGQRGNDLLGGGRGNDHLDGGAGIDTCSGGPGTDTQVRCEF